MSAPAQAGGSERFPIDLPDVVAEVRTAFSDYERALVEGDLSAMAAAFLDAEEIVRFGIADRQHGAAELAAWRARQPPLRAGRTLRATVVTTFGEDLAVVSTEFTYPGRDRLGRQSQTWLRTEAGWKIVAAHVSEIEEGDLATSPSALQVKQLGGA